LATERKKPLEVDELDTDRECECLERLEDRESLELTVGGADEGPNKDCVLSRDDSSRWTSIGMSFGPDRGSNSYRHLFLGGCTLPLCDLELTSLPVTGSISPSSPMRESSFPAGSARVRDHWFDVLVSKKPLERVRV
jgi:hypothetical protein